EISSRDLQERRLAETVGPEDRHALPAPHHQRDVDEDPLVAVGLRDVRDLENVAPALSFADEMEVRCTPRRRLELFDLDLLDLLEATLGLTRLGRLRSEALHPRFLLGDDRLRSRDLRFFALAYGRLLARERRVVARVKGDGAVVDVQDVTCD